MDQMSMEAKTMSLNRMENWRLSRIEEELEHLNINGLNLAGCDDYTYLDFDSKESTPDIPDIEYRVYKGFQQQPIQQQEKNIYSKAVIKPAHIKRVSSFSGEDVKRIEGIKKISDKYDSLERVKSHIAKSPGASQMQSHDFNFPPPLDPSRDLSYDPSHDLPSYDYDEKPPLAYGEDEDDGLKEDLSQDTTALTEHDVLQVEMFYRSHKTEVFVCQCMANLYYGAMKNAVETVDKWTFIKEGIPVFVLDSGDSRRARKLHLVLAEKGTGFTLWKDIVNHLTNYKAPHANFHTMHLSNDHTKVAGFSFDDSGSASDFMNKYIRLTSDPSDEILNLSKSKKKKDRKRLKLLKKFKRPTKADISTPCCFTHVTKLDRSEGLNIVVSDPCRSPVKLPRKPSVVTPDREVGPPKRP